MRVTAPDELEEGIHCECGICDHRYGRECVKKECACCLNFHVRSGPGRRDP